MQKHVKLWVFIFLGLGTDPFAETVFIASQIKSENTLVSADEESGDVLQRSFFSSNFALKSIVSFRAKATGSTSIYCRWQIDPRSAPAGVTVVRHPSRFPQSIQDGFVVYDGHQFACLDSSLKPETEAYYTVFAYDSEGLIAETDSNSHSYARTYPEEGIDTYWRSIPLPLSIPLRTVFALDSTHVWIAGESGALVHRGNDDNWMLDFQTFEYDFYDLFFLSPLQGWVAGLDNRGEGLTLYYSADEKRWIRSVDMETSIRLKVVFVSDSIGYSISSDGSVLKSQDAGHSFYPILQDRIFKFSALSFVDLYTGWAAGAEGVITHTRDGGEKWSVQNSGVKHRLTDLFFLDVDHGWATTDQGTVLLTQNGGINWTALRLSSDRLNSIHFSDPSNGICVGCNGALHRSQNGGLSWEPVPLDMTGELWDVFVDSPIKAWVVGDSGRCFELYRTTGATPFSGLNVRLSSFRLNRFPHVSCVLSVFRNESPIPVIPTADQIRIKENGRFRAVEKVEKLGPQNREMLDICFAIDLSTSTADSARHLAEHLGTWAERLDKVGLDWRMAVLSFSDQVHELTDWSTKLDDIRLWLANLPEMTPPVRNPAIGMQTLIQAFGRLGGRPGQRALVLMSGERKFTLPAVEVLIEQLRTSETQIFSIADEQAGLEPLTQAAVAVRWPCTVSVQGFSEGVLGLLENQVRVVYVSASLDELGADRVLNLGVEIDRQGGNTFRGFTVESPQLIITPEQGEVPRNGSVDLDLCARFLANVAEMHFFIDYDPALFRVEQVREGEFIQRNTPPLAFNARIFNTDGRVEINIRKPQAARAVAGSGVVCTLAVTAKTDTSAGVVSVSNLTITDSAGALLPVAGGSSQLRTIQQRYWAGDFDRDWDIDTQDFVRLATYWQPQNDPRGDIGPTIGLPPDCVPQPDGRVNYEDLFVFARMWNWFHDSEAWTEEPAKSIVSLPPVLRWEIDWQGNQTLRARLVGEDMGDLRLAHFRVGLPSNVRDCRVLQGEWLNSEGCAGLCLSHFELQSGWMEVDCARLITCSETVTPVAPTVVLFDIEYRANGSEIEVPRFLNIDCRDSGHARMAVRIDESQVAALPSAFKLFPPFPNPFNSQTVFRYQIAKSVPVRLAILDLLGRTVSVLCDERMNAGTYRAVWDGKDSAGNRIASGFYLAVLYTPELKKIQPLVLVR
ncbi:hypothetical protein JW992_11355 [candidate division KSB1 bacterium]|nr:hypothetical protein [candidate division KSB1 bacterium]